MKRWSRRFECNLLSLAKSATDSDISNGMRWYNDAHTSAVALASKFSLPLRSVVGVIAVLSPGAEWGRNLIDAETLISAWSKDLPIPLVGVYGRHNRDKAISILSGIDPVSIISPVDSPKVLAFYSAILDPNAPNLVPVIDQHIKSAMHKVRGRRRGSYDPSVAGVQRGEYYHLAWHLSKIAERTGFSPIQLQAILWLAWKNQSHPLTSVSL